MIGATLRMEWHAETHEGRVRDHNEDALFASDRLGVWAVADGMGGHERGEWASAAIVDALRAVPDMDDFNDQVSQTAAAIHQANTAIFTEAKARDISMGTTVVAAVIRDTRFAIVWAGDSRAYVLRDGQLHQLSRDHTRVQELIDRGFLTPEQSAGHPMSHVLSRAVGVMEDVELEAVTDVMQPGDVFLLCSDGLYGVVGEDEIAAALNSMHIDDAARALVAKCLDNGAPDNVTVVLIKASEATVLSLAPHPQALS